MTHLSPRPASRRARPLALRLWMLAVMAWLLAAFHPLHLQTHLAAAQKPAPATSALAASALATLTEAPARWSGAALDDPCAFCAWRSQTPFLTALPACPGLHPPDPRCRRAADPLRLAGLERSLFRPRAPPVLA